jgi:glycerol-3-phosphate acyltransferase PlsY
MKLFFVIVSSIIAYLFGSIPFGLLIGKVFFKKDIRDYGSHNIGGTNAGRVLGKPIGILVSSLDTLKCILAISITTGFYYLFFRSFDSKYYTTALSLVGLFCAIGHCFPIFADFRGGKAVATAFGFLVATNLIVGLVGIALYLLIILISRYVSLASIVTAVSSSVVIWVFRV